MRLNRVLVLCREQWTSNSHRMLRFESFVFTCLTYKNVQSFRNGPVDEFYGLKAGQMSKVHARSHEYPQVAKSRIFGNRTLKVRWPTTVTAKELTSRLKEKPHNKKNNLTAKRKNLTAKRKRPAAKRISSPCREVILFAVSLFPFAMKFLVFLFAVRLILLL